MQLQTQYSASNHLTLSVKRDDLIHSTISGNKWRKLKYTLLYAKEQGFKKVLSFGGGYSNHIHALAYAAKASGLSSKGIIRGEYDPFNPTIAQARSAGMDIEFISRLEYKSRHDPAYLTQLQQKHPDHFIIPEGGTSKFALQGVAEIINELPNDVTHICTPCGSGGTTAGLLTGAKESQQIVSIPVLKKAAYLQNEIATLLGVEQHLMQLDFIEDYHFGGYGKIQPELLTFIEDFYQDFGIILEPIYSGKMFYAIFDLIKQGFFPPGSHIVLLHTGGLQGLAGLKQRKLIPEDWPN
ncbi:1-aminocyclopropane-1-carboxylate deaminase/D-cysteine desulfhydrase [Psychrobium sp. 1_MG-2023]|uniref:1-aminocyclopropane-1-carboxylate deaminase/D-cysteine desulfhydrase n=1 Tax=Psychrobium sp. 1_MG-2023 TaxID=3062624 RepID=UPI0027325238|nr:pyridoxal-phosphate dependent enzyme [Psychrobium sp. 1_MG-2023]MDP2560870.1 pyridoxal-phosphate dependent enzyme [Psychrobium sp. 1_MG-2023]